MNRQTLTKSTAVMTSIDNKNRKREYKQVRLPKEVYDKLVTLGTAGSSIGDVIASLIREHEANESSNEGSEKETLYVYEGLCP
jgi:hypothetical protein